MMSVIDRLSIEMNWRVIITLDFHKRESKLIIALQLIAIANLSIRLVIILAISWEIYRTLLVYVILSHPKQYLDALLAVMIFFRYIIITIPHLFTIWLFFILMII